MANLSELEEIIAKGITSYREMGKAFITIERDRLYKKNHRSFRQYCLNRWSLSYSNVKQCMAAADVADVLEDIDPRLTPKTKSHAVELSKLPRSSVSQVWADTLKATNGKPTTQSIRDTAVRSKVSRGDTLLQGRQIRLTPEDWVWVDTQAKARGYSPSAFIRDLVHQDRNNV